MVRLLLGDRGGLFREVKMNGTEGGPIKDPVECPRLECY